MKRGAGPSRPPAQGQLSGFVLLPDRQACTREPIEQRPGWGGGVKAGASVNLATRGVPLVKAWCGIASARARAAPNALPCSLGALGKGPNRATGSGGGQRGRASARAGPTHGVTPSISGLGYTQNTLVRHHTACARVRVHWGLTRPGARARVRARNRNLVDPASSIRLSQRLSHACLSINTSIL